jgi:hypothetical protein
MLNEGVIQSKTTVSNPAVKRHTSAVFSTTIVQEQPRKATTMMIPPSDNAYQQTKLIMQGKGSLLSEFQPLAIGSLQQKRHQGSVGKKLFSIAETVR